MRALLSIVLALVLLTATGCSAKTELEVGMRPDGAGEIRIALTLDAEARNAIGGLGNQLRGSDLQRAGWNVGEARELEDGGERLEVSRKFSSPDEANQHLAQLTGTGGALKDFRLAQKRSLFFVESSFSGAADLSQGIDGFGNQSLLAATGRKLGIDSNELISSQGGNANELFPIELRVNLPGSTQSVRPQPSDQVWKLPYGVTTDLEKTSRGVDATAIALMVMGISSLIGAVLLWLRWRKKRFGAPLPLGRHARG